MSRLLSFLLALTLSASALAQVQAPVKTPVSTSGTLVVVPAFGEVRHANDEARVTFMVEEQDKDRVAAVNRVNQKMKRGTEIIKREDPSARLETQGYFTRPIYADEGGGARPRKSETGQRELVGWRVGQYLEMKTTNLDALPRTVAAAQRVLALNGLDFGLSDATSRKLEEQQIAAAYADLTQKLQFIAKAMGRSPAEAVLETVDFEGSGNYVPQAESATRMMSSKAMDSARVEEPSFEPGETTLSMRVVGRARFQ